MKQKILNGIDCLETVLKGLGTQKYLLVCGRSLSHLSIWNYINELPFSHALFRDFTPNPRYEDVCRGVALFNRVGCDTIVAAGGGSAIDVAKCIKLFSQMDSKQNYLFQEFRDSPVPLIAIPTTAGTGSESTRYAVIYYEGKKQSIMHDSILPNIAILDSRVLEPLPLYQKKCTVLDALCQGIESWWSVNSTEESKEYSRFAVQTILGNMDAYLFENNGEAAGRIMLSANYAGRAINITQTTAPHAMSYKLTSLYGLPHGHAVAVCLPEVWEYMLGHLDSCVDKRGPEYLKAVFDEIAEQITDKQFRELLYKCEINCPVAGKRESEIEILAGAVNPERLKNNPVGLSRDVIRSMYERIILK